MKKSIIIVILTFGVIGLNCCKKSAQPQAVVAGMTYKVDGVTKTATTVNAIIESFPDSKLLLINGTSLPDGISMDIQNAGVGTYYNRQSNGQLVSAVYSTGTDSFLAEIGGSVTITSFTADNISGTFQFTGTSQISNTSKVISDGQFNCKVINR